MTKENTEIYQTMIDDIANLSHEKFQKIYRKVNNGTRIKITKDELWIEQHGIKQADLAKLDYCELPSDWKNERWSGAKVALDMLLEAVTSSKPLNEKFIENASHIIHKDWLVRNINIAKDEHKLSYEQLSEEVREKDRIFVYSAIEIYKTKLKK